MKKVTDDLVWSLRAVPEIDFIGVIDSGSSRREISKFTFCKAGNKDAKKNGLRPNKGFNLGLQNWLKLDKFADYVLLLPNDSELINFDVNSLISNVDENLNIGAIVPLSPENGYNKILNPSGCGIGWNFHEGPILINSRFIHFLNLYGISLFDDSNFRGYLSFIELAIKMYANDWAIVATRHISFRENTDLLLSAHQLIKTEPVNVNMELILSEGREWLIQKYGFPDRWNLEFVAKSLFDEFIRIHSFDVIKPLI